MFWEIFVKMWIKSVGIKYKDNTLVWFSPSSRFAFAFQGDLLWLVQYSIYFVALPPPPPPPTHTLFVFVVVMWLPWKVLEFREVYILVKSHVSETSTVYLVIPIF